LNNYFASVGVSGLKKQNPRTRGLRKTFFAGTDAKRMCNDTPTWSEIIAANHGYGFQKRMYNSQTLGQGLPATF